MQTAITCRHGSIPDDLRENLARKSEKLLTYFERVTAIGVTVIFANEQIKDRIRVEILLDAEHKHNFVAIDEGDEILSTFDRALTKMEQQLKKYKAKIQDHRRGLNDVAGGDRRDRAVRSDARNGAGRDRRAAARIVGSAQTMTSFMAEDRTRDDRWSW